MRELQDRVAVITGGAGGIGRVMAEKIAAAGMRLVADVEDAALERVTPELRAKGADEIGVRTDVSGRQPVQMVAAATIGTFGAVHLLCNNVSA